MHGDIRQPQDAVLTKEDYETYGEKREVFSTALKGDLVERTFLFLGFSFTDPNIDYVLSRIRGLLGQNQRGHYCIMKWPDAPKDTKGQEQAEYEYQKRRLELRISDLSRYQIHAVMVNSYDEITEILRELNRRSHLRHIFVSGSSHDFNPLGKDRLEKLASRLGKEIIRRGFTLVSGFGRGIGGAVALGALEQVYADGLPISRVLMFPFPRKEPDGVTKQAFYSQYRTTMISNAGFAVFVSGNRKDPATNEVVTGKGVMEEFDVACNLGKMPVPFGASGWAAHSIWEKVSAQQDKYYGKANVSAPLKLLGESGKSDDEYVASIFRMIDDLAQ
jgi:Sir2- and TIR-associating SLOG family/SIR2-like domain